MNCFSFVECQNKETAIDGPSFLLFFICDVTGLFTCYLLISTVYATLIGFRKTWAFLKKTQPTGFLGFIGFFGFFNLNEQLGSLFVDSVHWLSFYLDSPVL